MAGRMFVSVSFLLAAACNQPIAPGPTSTADRDDRIIDFVAPAPAVSPGPPVATSTTEACVAADAADYDHERQREQAALDKFLRARGGMVLHPQKAHYNPDLSTDHILIHDHRRWLVMGLTSPCGADMVVAMDASGAVFVVDPLPEATTTKTIRVCQPQCAPRCDSDKSVAAVVEVPAGAHPAPRRKVTFPMDTRVVFAPTAPCPSPTPSIK
ncbi:MAG TPA: hypothetical protein VFG83_17105 [Kofleriaceae bacterium]|nr:hypothetical protein [Kofleriaceae bacterium]